MANRFEKRKKTGTYIDFTLLILIIFLLAFGLVMIYSTSFYKGALEHDNPRFFLRSQIISIVVGLVVMFGAAIFPLNALKKISPIIYIVTIASILLVLVPGLGKEVNGARRWITVMGFSIQPAELVKIGVILFVANILNKMSSSELKMWKPVIFSLGLAAIPAGLLYFVTDNMSSAILVGGISFTMLICTAKGNIKPYILLAFVVLIAAVFVYLLANGKVSNQIGFRGERILAWLNPEAYADGKGFQTLQALYGIGSGGTTGKGLGKSMQKLGFLPEAYNDMIFSVICEELGLFGGFAILIAFLLLLWRIKDATTYSEDKYGNIVVAGIFGHIALQVIFNIAVVTNTIPNTGITLPFISHGGSAVICLLGEMGLVFNVSRRQNFYDDVIVPESAAQNEASRRSADEA